MTGRLLTLLAFQLEEGSVQQHRPNQQELLVIFDTDVISAQPVPVPLPPVVLVEGALPHSAHEECPH